jgi:hypothetical protein
VSTQPAHRELEGPEAEERRARHDARNRLQQAHSHLFVDLDKAIGSATAEAATAALLDLSHLRANDLRRPVAEREGWRRFFFALEHMEGT